MDEPLWVTVDAICDECKLSAEVRGAWMLSGE